ncbi:MAG: GNAT family N-acetyltransferase [Syntrophaceae bacterium]|nr:GNAT family N-acetyltransferase [Syntrophaceae bacterium]
MITFDMENWKRVREATPDHFDGWLELAREVEPLFGPMVDDAAFREGLKRAIEEKIAWCIEEPEEQDRSAFRGGIVASREANEILWLAVSGDHRGRGTGAALLSEAIGRLDRSRPITVTTFDDTIPDGLPARRLYQRFGFEDSAAAGLNPAGIPTVTMTLMEKGARGGEG